MIVAGQYDPTENLLTTWDDPLDNTHHCRVFGFEIVVPSLELSKWPSSIFHRLVRTAAILMVHDEAEITADVFKSYLSKEYKSTDAN